MRSGLFLLWALLLPWHDCARGQAEPQAFSLEGAAIATVRDIQTEAAQQPFQEKLVATSGVVTWADMTAGKFFYVQDGTGGIQIAYEDGPDPSPEDFVEIVGVLRLGSFSPVIGSASVRIVKKAPMPGFRRTSSGGILNGVSLGERVELEGRVRRAQMLNSKVLGFDLMSGTSRVFVRVSNTEGINPDELIGCKVRARGVVSPVKARGINKHLVDVELLVPDKADFFIDKHPATDPWHDPVVSFENAFQYRPGKSQGDRWHVSGQVILVADGAAYLNDGKSGLEVKGQEVDKLVPGTWVEAVGFPDLVDHLPVLSDSVFGPATSENPKLSSVELPAASLLDGLRHASYVSVTGRLLDRMQTPSKTPSQEGKAGGATLILALQSPQGVVNAELRVEDTPTNLPEIEIGGTLRIGGVCLVQTNYSGDAAAFKLLVPSPSDITVLRKADFFTVKRLLILLSVVLAILLLATSAAFLLSRRNTYLQTKMRERQAVAMERSRIARDMHDNLEQGLMGIHFQLYGARALSCETSPDTREWLGRIRSLVQECHAAMRTSIWNLRSLPLEHSDLGEALAGAARSLSQGSSLEIEIKKDMGHHRLPPEVEDDLLHIGQEALTNAVKHSGAARLAIDIRVNTRFAILTVSDNGRGLRGPPGGSSPTSGFGLKGMRERAARMGGEFEIRSAPESGCIVRVQVPLKPSRHA